MDQALSLVQRYHLSQQSMQEWLDSTAALLHGASSGVELENLTGLMRDLEETSAQEKNFAAGLEEMRTLDSLLVDFLKAGVISELREKVQAVQLRSTEVKQQVDAYRGMLQRCVLFQSLLMPVLHAKPSLYVFPFFITCHSALVCDKCVYLRCGTLWSSFQNEKKTLVEQITDLETRMAMFTTAKAISVHEAEEKCQRHKVGQWGRRIN